MRRIARDHFRHAVECDDGQIVPDHVRRLRVAQWPSQFVKNALLGGYSYQTDRLWADLVKRQMCIRRSEWRGHVTVPKGGRLRYVPMTARLASAVHDHRHLESPRVLCLEDGSPLTQDIVGEHVRKGRTTGGVPASGAHRLRHTFCSQLAMRGAPARAIQELAGHSGPHDDAAVHASEPGGSRERDPVVGATGSG
jgi:integrase-like protein